MKKKLSLLKLKEKELSEVKAGLAPGGCEGDGECCGCPSPGAMCCACVKPA